MGYFLDNTVEIEVNGEIHRVFAQEAEIVKAKLLKMGKKITAKTKDSEATISKKFDNLNPEM
jgi:hypothetical protein